MHKCGSDWLHMLNWPVFSLFPDQSDSDAQDSDTDPEAWCAQAPCMVLCWLPNI